MNELRTKDLEHYIALESSSLRLQLTALGIETKMMATAQAIRDEDTSYGDSYGDIICPWIKYEVEGDVDYDPRLESSLYGINPMHRLIARHGSSTLVASRRSLLLPLPSFRILHHKRRKL